MNNTKNGVRKIANKKYPFSARKHAHDIEFRMNRAHNTQIEMLETCPVPMSAQDSRKVADLHSLEFRLSGLLSRILGTQDQRGVAWLDGQDWGLATESVTWAQLTRDETQGSKKELLP